MLGNESCAYGDFDYLDGLLDLMERFVVQLRFDAMS